MASNSQMLKGVMEGVILKIIYEEETYGYEIYQRLMMCGFNDFAEGSLYPLLLRLEKKKIIKSVKKPSDIGPDRKYYFLTEEGKKQMDEFKVEWDRYNNSIQKLWK